mmetsp:Transcript_43125/g.87197  ORF Transcript_43125/g.87197 Transcript_43125/m.87197 type:complete len:204 (-) Transcript_43125:571-1182(-)
MDSGARPAGAEPRRGHQRNARRLHPHHGARGPEAPGAGVERPHGRTVPERPEARDRVGQSVRDAAHRWVRRVGPLHAGVAVRVRAHGPPRHGDHPAHAQPGQPGSGDRAGGVHVLRLQPGDPLDRKPPSAGRKLNRRAHGSQDPLLRVPRAAELRRPGLWAVQRRLQLLRPQSVFGVAVPRPLVVCQVGWGGHQRHHAVRGFR